jgi:predicted DNA-binding transcriptional regulator AlpA
MSELLSGKDLLSRGFVTERQAGERLGFSAQTLKWWRKTGRSPRFYKVGRFVYYKDTDFDAWLEAQACEPAGESHA